MRTKIALSLALTALVALLAAGPAQAALTVANTNDSGPGSLRQAIAEAGAGETINVPAGDYQVSSAPLEVTKSLTIAGAASNATVIRSVGPFRVFTVAPPAMEPINVTFSGMTIRDGRVFEETAFGAGIASITTNLTLRQAHVTGNLADANGEAPGVEGGNAFGGGVLVLGGSLTMIESQVTGNTAEGLGGPEAEGGGAQGGGVVVIGGPVTIEKSTVSGNIARANGGQGPTNGKQDGGLAAAGGFGATVGPGASSIVASTFSGNVAEAAPGPGGDAGEVAGGGVFARATEGTLALTNSTVSGNTVSNGNIGGELAAGGGLALVVEEGGTMTVTSATIAANRLEASSENSRGGNLFAGGESGSMALRNTIVANGAGPAGSENCGIGTGTNPIASQGFNLDSLDQCGFKAPGDQVNKDPLLLPLQDFGGPTQTMAPAAGSPIVDQGAAFGLTGDQHGAPRPIDLPSIPSSSAPGADGSDIGAYELQPSNAFTLGKFKRNEKKGTATLAVKLPQPSAGSVTLKGKGLKAQTARITGQAEVKLKVAAKSKAIRKALEKKGKRKVKIEVTYTPTGNAAATQSRKAKLIKKRKKHKRKHQRGAKR